MNQDFVRVPNNWFQESNDITFVSNIGANAFTLWYAINKVSVQMNMSKVIQLQIKQVVIEMKGIKGFAKPENVRKLLLTLKRHRLIECNQLTDKTKPTDLINIKLIEPDYTNGFSPISCDLYNDKILKIQPVGFLIYCLLYKNHNINLGGSTSSGHAEITRESICRFTGINSVKTVSNAIDVLKKSKGLVRVEQSKIISNLSNGKYDTKYLPNCYVILAKIDTLNKYYIDFK